MTPASLPQFSPGRAAALPPPITLACDWSARAPAALPLAGGGASQNTMVMPRLRQISESGLRKNISARFREQNGKMGSLPGVGRVRQGKSSLCSRLRGCGPSPSHHHHFSAFILKAVITRSSLSLSLSLSLCHCSLCSVCSCSGTWPPLEHRGREAARPARPTQPNNQLSTPLYCENNVG